MTRNPRNDVVKALGPLGLLVSCAQVSSSTEFHGEAAVKLLAAAGATEHRVFVKVEGHDDGKPYAIEYAELRCSGLYLKASWHRFPTDEEVEQTRKSGELSGNLDLLPKEKRSGS